MKSAYERAMEKVGGEVREFTPEQKAQLTELHAYYEAKLATAHLHAHDALRKAGLDKEKVQQIRDDMVVEVASLTEERDRKKEALRQGFPK